MKNVKQFVHHGKPYLVIEGDEVAKMGKTQLAALTWGQFKNRLKKNEGESMGIELQSILEGMKRLRAASSKIRKLNQSLLFITDIEKVQIQNLSVKSYI